jgi:hypothetical protein
MHKAFDAVVGGGKAVGIDHVLVNGHGVAAQKQLGLNEVAVDFAPTGWRQWKREPVATPGEFEKSSGQRGR